MRLDLATNHEADLHIPQTAARVAAKPPGEMAEPVEVNHLQFQRLVRESNPRSTDPIRRKLRSLALAPLVG